METNDSAKIVELLKENNTYLRELLQLKKKEHSEAVFNHAIHIIISVVPALLVAILGYFVWQSLQHYLDVLNENINTLKTNFDLLREFFQKLIPDFSQIVPKLKDTWETVKFWE